MKAETKVGQALGYGHYSCLPYSSLLSPFYDLLYPTDPNLSF